MSRVAALAGATVGLFAAAARADGPAEGPPRARVTVGLAFAQGRNDLRVTRFVERPAAAPARDEDDAEVGEQFAWSLTTALVRAEVATDRVPAFRAWVGGGVCWGTFHEESLAHSRLFPSAPRANRASDLRTGLAVGAGASLAWRAAEAPWWGGLAADFLAADARADNALLFDGAPYDGRVTSLVATLAARGGARRGAASAWLGCSAAWADVSTQWDLAVTVPGLDRQMDADFTLRNPVRLLLGASWTADDLVATFELALWNPAADWRVSATLSVPV